MATQDEIKTLAALYLSARERLLNTIINHKGVGTKTYYNTVLRQLQKELKELQKHSDVFIETAIPREYRKALRETYAYFQRNHLRMRAPSVFASLHTDALYEISREMQYQISLGIASVGRQVERYTDTAMDEALRQAGLRQSGIKTASGATVQDMRNALLEQLQSEGFMTVQYGVGAGKKNVPVDVYASMVSRSTTREAGNTARLNQLTYNGYDLVQMSTHYPTCEVCAALQGRVYSISGKDPRFPPLSKAFNEYNNVHPNCRHVITPWIESLKTEEEIAEAIEFSNRPFVDTRKKEEIDLYNRQQGESRRLRNDLYQYERYKAVLGDDAPKSPMAFRKIKQAGGEKWGILQAKYRGMGYYSKAVANEPEITNTIVEIAQKVDMKPVGLEYRIKSQDSYLRKIEANYVPGGNEYEVKDILRYTYTAPAENLTDKTMKSVEIYGNKGYNTSAIKNYWLVPDSPYKGINTTVTAPNGQKFEIQYHTPESFALKNGELHQLYEEWRLLPVGAGKKLELEKEMIKLSRGVQTPVNIEKVK